MAGFLHYSSILAEKKKSGDYNYLKSVPGETVLHAQLKDEEYRVMRLGETETAFRNKYWNNTKPGIYVDVITNDPLFSSRDQFDSGTGRPTFTKPISPDAVLTVRHQFRSLAFCADGQDARRRLFRIPHAVRKKGVTSLAPFCFTLEAR
ncbi:MAG TPA: peptide-methionine (R)-S-oxide reductase [Chthoniobacterales bacterium]